MKVDIIPGKDLKFRLLEPLRFHVTVEGFNHCFEAPIGMISDGASVPRFFWRILPPFGPYMRAAVAHDYLYRVGYLTKNQTDRVLSAIALEDGTPYWQVNLIELGLYVGGKDVWDKYRKLQAKGVNCVFIDDIDNELHANNNQKK